MRCKKCGTMLKADAKICPNCGTQTAENAGNAFPSYHPAASASGDVSDVVKCTGCGTELKKNTKFCPSCGAKVEPPKAPETPSDNANICKGCGAELKPGTKFCPVCGTKTEPAAPAPSPAPAAEKCVQCGSELKPGAKFCPVCGAKAGQPAPEPKPVPIPEAAPVIPPAPKPVEAPKAETEQKPVEQTEAPQSDNANIVKCNSCGSQLKPGAKFCPVCGAKAEQPAPAEEKPVPAAETAPVIPPAPKPVEAPKSETEQKPAEQKEAPQPDNNIVKCNACGSQLKPGAKFCPVCGAKTESAAPADKPKTIPAPTLDGSAQKAPGNQCPDCGFELKPGAKFCPVCGKNLSAPTSSAPAAPVAPAANTSPVPSAPIPNYNANPAGNNAFAAAPGGAAVGVQKKPFNFVPFLIGGGILVVIVVAVIIIVNIMNQPPKVNLDDYINVEFSGYEGYGEVSASFDSNKFEEDWGDKLKYAEDPSNYTYSYLIDNSNPATLISYVLKYSLDVDNYNHLKNGDKIKIKWDITNSVKETITRYVKCELIYNEKEFTVQDLKELTKVDPFENDDITVEFTGEAPNGKAYVYNYSNYSFDCELDKENGLSNGDKVKVTIVPYSKSTDLDEYLADYYHIILTTKEKEFTVSGLATSVSTVKDIPANALSAMKNETEDFIKSDTVGTNRKFKSAEYIGTIVLSPKSDNSTRSRYYYVVYKVTVTITDSSTKKTSDFEYYTYNRFENITINEDGTYSPTFFSGTKPYRYVYPKGSYSSFDGYESYSELYDDVVTSSLNYYKPDTDIDETTLTKPAQPEESSEPEESSKPEESSTPEESSKSEESSKPEESSKSEESSALQSGTLFNI